MSQTLPETPWRRCWRGSREAEREPGDHHGDAQPDHRCRRRPTEQHPARGGDNRNDEVPLGQARWLTVVSPDDPDGCELLLEPDGHPAAKPFKEALVNDGIPYTSFAVEDVRAEFEPSVGVPTARLPPDALMRGTTKRPGSVRP